MVVSHLSVGSSPALASTRGTASCQEPRALHNQSAFPTQIPSGGAGEIPTLPFAGETPPRARAGWVGGVGDGGASGSERDWPVLDWKGRIRSFERQVLAFALGSHCPKGRGGAERFGAFRLTFEERLRALDAAERLGLGFENLR
ncbi:hypothetical protein NL676_023092 [Syzygium grande]|nr:hypothetical protein NL676_023092 [Syzygium grande]